MASKLKTALVRMLLAAIGTPARRRISLVVAAAVVAAIGGVYAYRTSSAPESTFCNTQVAPKPPAGDVEWSFLFLDADIVKLEKVRRDLQSRGFTFETYQRGPCSDCGLLQLRMMRTEAHDVDTMRARESELCGVARTHGLHSYWGMLETEKKYWR